MIELTTHAIEDRVPVIAGVGFGQRLAIEMAQAAEKAGADGILAFPPYYPQAEADGLFEYYRSIGAATSLGMVIYSRDWAAFTPEMVERFTEIPTVVALKEGHGDIRRLQSIIHRASAIGCSGSAAPATTWLLLITASAFVLSRPASPPSRRRVS